MLILSGVTINIAINGGLIEKAREAAEMMKEEQDREKALLEGFGWGSSEEYSLEMLGLKVGDIIDYRPTEVPDGYNPDIDENGEAIPGLFTGWSNGEQNIMQAELTWRVLGYDEETKDVLLISDKPAYSEENPEEYCLNFYGSKGYTNYEEVLNRTCEALYSNKTMGATAQSITMEDINKYLGGSEFDGPQVSEDGPYEGGYGYKWKFKKYQGPIEDEEEEEEIEEVEEERTSERGIYHPDIQKVWEEVEEEDLWYGEVESKSYGYYIDGIENEWDGVIKDKWYLEMLLGRKYNEDNEIIDDEEIFSDYYVAKKFANVGWDYVDWKVVVVKANEGTIGPLDCCCCSSEGEQNEWGSYLRPIVRINAKNFGNAKLAELGLKQGDYVNYKPTKVKKGYNVDGENAEIGALTGETYIGEQIITQEDLKWRVLGYDEANDKVLLISETPTSNEKGNYLSFRGHIGYRNYEDVLNNTCKELYSNNKLGAVARSITMEDIDNYLGGKAFDKTTIEGYGDEYEFENIYHPDIENWSEGNNTWSGTLENTMFSYVADGLADPEEGLITDRTKLELLSGRVYNKDEVLIDTLFSQYENYCVASRYVDAYSYERYGTEKNIAIWYASNVRGKYVNIHTTYILSLCDSDGLEWDGVAGSSLRPIVSVSPEAFKNKKIYKIQSPHIYEDTEIDESIENRSILVIRSREIARYAHDINYESVYDDSIENGYNYEDAYHIEINNDVMEGLLMLENENGDIVYRTWAKLYFINEDGDKVLFENANNLSEGEWTLCDEYGSKIYNFAEESEPITFYINDSENISGFEIDEKGYLYFKNNGVRGTLIDKIGFVTFDNPSGINTAMDPDIYYDYPYGNIGNRQLYYNMYNANKIKLSNIEPTSPIIKYLNNLLSGLQTIKAQIEKNPLNAESILKEKENYEVMMNTYGLLKCAYGYDKTTREYSLNIENQELKNLVDDVVEIYNQIKELSN